MFTNRPPYFPDLLPEMFRQTREENRIDQGVTQRTVLCSKTHHVVAVSYDIMITYLH